MKFALARHDMLLRRSIEQHGGYDPGIAPAEP
jgi:hypothetical protein